MKATILGAIAGDIIGSVYEFDPTRDYDFSIIRPDMEPTDDSIMTIAVADWILTDPTLSPSALIDAMHRWGNRYPWPKGGYGGRFAQWLRTGCREPYGSWGNGSAMRVSPVGFAFDTLKQTVDVAAVTAAVTHNHPEGIKGAQATAAAIFMARNGASKDEIEANISATYGYDLSRTYADLRGHYGFDESCQGTVPESIIAFLDSRDYEDAIRLTVSLGGDADTMGAITGGIAAAYYGEMPQAITDFAMAKLPADMRRVVDEFLLRYGA